MSIFIFIATLIVAYLVIKIGGAAFELTGMDPEQSHFQALSAFTGTGFTTRESELIVVHKQRRKIASSLIILGNAGFVTLIATLVNSIKSTAPGSTISIPGLSKGIPAFLVPYMTLSFILIILYVIHRLFRSSKLAIILKQKVQQKMIDNKYIQPVCFEEFLLSTSGYGVSQIEIIENNPLLGKTLSESRLREHGILVLSVERGDEHILNPSPDIRFTQRDRLVCFGRLDDIRKIAYI